MRSLLFVVAVAVAGCHQISPSSAEACKEHPACIVPVDAFNDTCDAACLTAAEAAEGEGEGEGEAPVGEGEGGVGEGEGEGEPPAGEGEGEGEAETTCLVADDCAALVYSACTCTADDPCAWSGDSVCDEEGCARTVGFTFNDVDCDAPPPPPPDPCGGFIDCLIDEYGVFDFPMNDCSGYVAFADMMHDCAARAPCETEDGSCRTCLADDGAFCDEGRARFPACSGASGSFSVCQAGCRITNYCSETVANPNCGGALNGANPYCF